MIRAVRAEAVKIATLTRLWLPLLVGVLIGPLAALLLLVQTHPEGDGASVRLAGAGIVLTLVIVAVWAGLAPAAEFQSGSITSTLVAVASRRRFYLGKVITVSGIAFTATAASSLLSLLVLRVAGSPGRGWPDVVALLGGSAVVAAAGAAAVAAGFLLRGPLPTAAVVLVALFGPKLAGTLLGELQPWVVGSSPNALIQRLIGNTELPPTEVFPVGPAAAVATLLAGAAAALLGAWVSFSRSEL